MTTTTLERPVGLRPGRVLTVSLWSAQVLLAAMFAFSSYHKLALSIADISRMTPWAADLPWLIRFIGLAELAGAIGILLPALTRILPWLTSLAALGLATVMVLATAYHVARGELMPLPITLGLGGLAVFVAWGRHWKAPIAPRA
jgi:putative oxidoreductase